MKWTLLLVGIVLFLAAALAGYVDVPPLRVGIGVAYAVATTALLYVLLRFNVPMWLGALALLLPLLPQLGAPWASYWHGFMHSSIVYEIFERGSPPENPLMVGEPLRYMYGHHVLLAWLMRVIPISPPQGFVLTDVVTLLLFAVCIERTARLISGDRVFRILAVFLAAFSLSPLVGGPFTAVLHEAPFPFRGIEWRMIPLTKFFGINNNQVGLLFSALALLGLVAIASGRERRWLPYVGVSVAIVGAGLLYPPAWVQIVGCAGAAALYLLICGRRELRVPAIVLGGLSALCAAAVLPSILSLTAGKSEATLTLSGPFYLAVHGANLVLFLAVPAALVWLNRTTLAESYRRQPQVAGVLLVCAAVTMAMYGAVHMPGSAEYKFLHLTVLALSFPIALALQNVYRKHAAVALLLLFSIALPTTGDFTHQVPVEPVSDPVRTAGRVLRHADPDEDALYTWMSGETPSDALFIDTHLTIPVLARRQLVVGLDMRRDSGALEGYAHDGWLITADEFLTANTGVDAERLAALRAIARALLSPESGGVDRELLSQLPRYTLDRPIYVVARDETVHGRLIADAQFKQEFSSEKSSVFRFEPQSLSN
jgi:hypothetical protein